jgi:hypothetical protein
MKFVRFQIYGDGTHCPYVYALDDEGRLWSAYLANTVYWRLIPSPGDGLMSDDRQKPETPP